MMIFKHAHCDLGNRLTSEIEYTVHNEGDIHEVMNEFRQFLLAVGYHPETVERYIKAE